MEAESPMAESRFNRYRAALDILLRGRDLLVGNLADDILEQGDELIEGGYQFHEFLESQGTRLHFLCLLIGQLEQSAEMLDESRATQAPEPAPTPAPASKPPAKRRSRSKKIQQQAPTKGTTDDL